MGVFDKRNRKRFEKLLDKNGDLIYEMINEANVYYYNQGLISDNERNKVNVFTRQLQENSVWNQGIVENLEWFYKNTYPKLSGYSNDTKPALSYFWAKVTPKTVRVHSGIPALISKTMVNMIAGPGLDYTVVDETETEQIENTEQTERLDAMLKDNCFEDVLFPNGVNMASYGGYFGWKLSYDLTISDKPILEFVKPESVEVIQKRGRNVGYIFKSLFEENDDTYELHEIYSKNDMGYAQITYKMFKYNGAKLEEVDIDKSSYKNVVFVGLENIPAGIINNTTTNQQFKDSPYGQSDYNNSQPIFNAMDENLSQLMTAIRFARPKRFFSNDMLQQNAVGNKELFDDFEVDYELVDGEDGVTNQYIPIDTKLDMLMYSESGVLLLMRALNNAGLSPTSVGVTDLEAKNASADSQREREKASLRTRQMKLKVYRNSFEYMFNVMLQFDDIAIQEVATQEYMVSVQFNDYSIPSLEQRIETMGKALNEGLVDVKNATAKTWLDDLTETELEAMNRNIKIENGIPLTEEQVNEEPETT